MNQLQWRDKKDDVDNDDWLREYCFAIDASAFWLDSHKKEWGFLYIDFMGDNLAEIERRDQLETQDIQERVDCDASGNEFQSPHQCCWKITCYLTFLKLVFPHNCIIVTLYADDYSRCCDDPFHGGAVLF